MPPLEDKSAQLPPIPGDIKACAFRVIPSPEALQTKEQVSKAMEDLIKSDRAKTYCGKRLIQFYEANKNKM